MFHISGSAGYEAVGVGTIGILWLLLRTPSFLLLLRLPSDYQLRGVFVCARFRSFNSSLACVTWVGKPRAVGLPPEPHCPTVYLPFMVAEKVPHATRC